MRIHKTNKYQYISIFIIIIYFMLLKYRHTTAMYNIYLKNALFAISAAFSSCVILIYFMNDFSVV